MIDIDIIKAKKAFKEYLNTYKDKSHVSFNLKVKHTYHVSENAKEIATKLDLNEEDIKLAELIGLLHDIGRFEEIIVTGELNSMKFDHAEYGSKILFENNLIRNFIEENKYDKIIKKAIENHNKLEIEDGLDEKTLLHCKIIRDADKLDIFRVKIEADIEALYPLRVVKIEDMENSVISDKVYESIIHERCVVNSDRVYPLDFYLNNLAFLFDINFDITFKMLKETNYVNMLIDRFTYKDEKTRNRMVEIKEKFNNFIDKKLSCV